MRKLFSITIMSVMCLYTYAQTGSTCATPYVISTLPFNLSASTDSTGDNYDNICGSVFSDENDFVLEYTPATDKYLNIVTSNTNIYTGLFVTLGCPDVGSCVTYVESSLGNPVINQVYLTAGNTYYFTISTNDPTGLGLNTSTAFTIDITEIQPFDAGVISIESPNSGCSLTAAETISCTIKNFGADTIGNFDVNYTINGGTPVTETFSGTILPDSTAIFLFAALTDLSINASYEIIVSTSLTSDADATNDADTTLVYNTPVLSSFPYVQDFESTPMWWYTEGNNSSWELGSPAGAVINSAASPTNAWVTNLTGNHNVETSYLVSPCFDFTSIVTPRIEFNLWYETTQFINTVSFEYSTDNGATWQSLPSGSSATSWDNPWSGSSSGWIPVANTVPGLGGLPNVKFRFTFNAILANNEGVAVDDIQISDCVAGIPTADFTYTQDTSHVEFTNNSSNATTYYWDFGDFQTSTDPNPAHDYFNISNSYTVMLVAMNDCNSDTIYQTITVVGNDLTEIDNKISIYPNPAHDKIYVQAPLTGTITLTDLTGKVIFKSDFQNQKYLNINKIAKGTYLLLLENDKYSVRRKLVVE